jgi:leucyl aminopeptidase (aminopeptidase T)
MKRMLMMKGAKKVVEDLAGVKPEENVIVVTDTNKFSIAECLATAAHQVGANVFLTVMPPLKRVGSHSDKIPDVIMSAMSKADVILSPTTDSTTSSVRAAVEASGGKARGLSLAAWTDEMLYKGGIEADFDKIKEETHDPLLSKLEKAKNGYVTSPAGTNLKVELVPRARGYPGIARNPGEVAGPPDIEVNARPVKGTAEGVLVVDGAICIYPELGPLWEPVKITVEEGKIKQIQSGREAKIFEEIYKEILKEDPQTANLAEFACGLNTSCYFTGNYFEDEGSGETMHFGFGGSWVGGIYHIDLVIKKPRLELDGELILEDGKLV